MSRINNFLPPKQEDKSYCWSPQILRQIIQCHNDKYAKQSILFQSSKFGRLITPEELCVNEAGEGQLCRGRQGGS